MPAGSLPVKTAVLALCGALFLGACSSDAEGGGSSSTTPDAVETSAPVSSPSGTTALGSPGSSEPSGGGSGDASPSGGSGAPTSPQPSTPDGETPAPPVMPAAAKENTAEGAEAFARWYVESINHLFRYPQAGVIDEFSAPSCEQCQRIAETVEEFESKGQRADRLPLAMKDEARVTPSGRGKFLVGVQFDHLETGLLDHEGNRFETLPRDPDSGFLLTVQFEHGWKVLSMPVQRHAAEGQ